MNEFQVAKERKDRREAWPSRKHIKEGREALVRELDTAIAGVVSPVQPIEEKPSEKPKSPAAKPPSIVVTVSNGAQDITVTLAAPVLNGTLPRSAFNAAAIKERLIKALQPDFGRLT